MDADARSPTRRGRERCIRELHQCLGRRQRRVQRWRNRTIHGLCVYRASADLAREAGDAEAASRHHAWAAQIQRQLKAVLWLKDRGHPAEYRERLGHRRLNESACVHTIFLPIDAECMTSFEAAQMIHYTEWGLERTPQPAGGERCWQSNWVPYVWSVRELYLGDSCHLALACYQAGLLEEARDLLEGRFAESALNRTVPAAFSSRGMLPTSLMPVVCWPGWSSKGWSIIARIVRTTSSLQLLASHATGPARRSIPRRSLEKCSPGSPFDGGCDRLDGHHVDGGCRLSVPEHRHQSH